MAGGPLAVRGVPALEGSLSDDPDHLDVACDVVIRLKGHGSYKGHPGALKALARRAPGSTEEDRRTLLDLLCRVYDRAVEAIQRHRAERPGKVRRFAEFEDIDFNACLAELEAIEPGVATEQKRAILTWVIYWHYLK
jgi:hypothetical protein